MKRRGNWLLSVVVSLALLVSLAVPALASVEPVPHSFYGTLTMDGSDILAPAEIVAVVEGGGGSIITSVDGEYGSPEPLGAKLVVSGYIERGATIHFYVDTVEANETFPFKSFAITNLDLTVPEIGVTHDLTMAVVGNGTVTPGTGTYAEGPMAITATPASGWLFSSWSTADMDEIAVPTDESTTLTLDKDKTVTATFTQITHDLTMAVVGNGTVTPGTGTYPEGPMAITATPASGWSFSSWSTDDMGEIAVPTDESTTLTLDKDKTVTATFAEVGVTYDLTVASTAGGSVTEPGEPGPFTYDAGEVVDLLAVPDEYYVFINWTGDVGTIADPDAADTNIIMNGDYAITANFAPEVGTLQLCPGWNTMSVPIALHPSIDTWGEFSAGLDVDPSAITYYFDSSIPQWKQVFDDYPLKPCDAIYVKMASEDTATIIASLLPSVPTKQLYAGWNLVGLAYLPMAEDALPGMKANEALISVKEVTGDLTGYVVVVSPPVCQWPWIYVGGDIDDWDGEWPAPDGWMLIGSGYWVFMLNEGTLAGFTFTPLGG